MAVQVQENGRLFTISTANTTYQMKADRYGVLLHLYYGRRCEGSMEYLLTYADRGYAANIYDAGDDRTYSLDFLPQEFPCDGTGDMRSPALSLEYGNRIHGCDMRFVSYAIKEGKYGLKGLPAVYADKTCGTDYYTYILAEYVNDGKDTDYACTPVEITIPDASGGGLDLKPDTKHDDDDDSDNGSSDPKPKDEKLDELRANLKTAIDKGGYQTVTWDKGTALPYDIMKTLQDNPKITLVFSYTYENVFFKVTLPGQSVKAYTNIPWYGPLYLYAYYGGCGAIPECPED